MLIKRYAFAFLMIERGLSCDCFGSGEAAGCRIRASGFPSRGHHRNCQHLSGESDGMVVKFLWPKWVTISMESPYKMAGAQNNS